MAPRHLGSYLVGSHLRGNRVACKQVQSGLTFMLWLVFRDEHTLLCKVRWCCKVLQETRKSIRDQTQFSRHSLNHYPALSITIHHYPSLSINIQYYPALSSMNQRKSQLCTCWRGILSPHLVTTADFQPSASCPLAETACGSGFCS